MAQPTLIGPVPPSTPSGQKTPRRHELPPDLLREASSRLSLVAFVGGSLWLVGSLFGHLFTGRTATHSHEGQQGIDYLVIPDMITAGVVITSYALALYARKSKREPRFLLDLGLGYLIVLSLAMGQMFHWSPMP